jgi:hypothetical protein
LLQGVCPGLDNIAKVTPKVEEALAGEAEGLTSNHPESKIVLKELGLWALA